MYYICHVPQSACILGWAKNDFFQNSIGNHKENMLSAVYSRHSLSRYFFRYPNLIRHHTITSNLMPMLNICIVNRASLRINILKAHAGTNWGEPKETILHLLFFQSCADVLVFSPVTSQVCIVMLLFLTHDLQ